MWVYLRRGTDCLGSNFVTFWLDAQLKNCFGSKCLLRRRIFKTKNYTRSILRWKYRKTIRSEVVQYRAGSAYFQARNKNVQRRILQLVLLNKSFTTGYFSAPLRMKSHINFFTVWRRLSTIQIIRLLIANLYRPPVRQDFYHFRYTRVCCYNVIYMVFSYPG